MPVRLVLPLWQANLVAHTGRLGNLSPLGQSHNLHSKRYEAVRESARYASIRPRSANLRPHLEKFAARRLARQHGSLPL
jgi:hypothetical protein